MHHVFISYSSKDIAQAQAVRNVLEQNGISCWMAPEDIPGGSNYTKEIPTAIRGCQAFVLMLSDNAQHSHWVLKELDNAVNEGKIILPFQLEDVPLSDEFNFLLTGAQRYDAYQKKAEALQLLVSRIKAIIDATPKNASTPQPEPKEEPVSEPPKEKKPLFQKPKQQKAESPSVFDGTSCSACGSLDVTKLPDKVTPREPVEFLVSFAAAAVGAVVMPILCLIVGFVAESLFLMIPGLDPDIYEAVLYIFMFLTIPSLIGGIILGSRIAGEWIRRRRIRSHIAVEHYHCNTCQKKFQIVNDI